MKALTTDRFTVTTIEQDGPLAGEEIGQVFLIRRNGYNYWNVESIATARRLICAAKNQTAEQFAAAAKGGGR